MRLSNGTLVLRKCSGILPDGTCFSIPRNHSAPPSKTLSDLFSHHKSNTLIFTWELPLLKREDAALDMSRAIPLQGSAPSLKMYPMRSTGGDPKEDRTG
jgi:predicted component of type VI protein secretion system